MDISEFEEEIDIQKIIDELKRLKKDRQEIEIQVNKSVKEIGFNA